MTHVHDTGNFDRTICPEPCGAMHSYCAVCGKRQDPCAFDVADAERRGAVRALRAAAATFRADEEGSAEAEARYCDDEADAIERGADF